MENVSRLERLKVKNPDMVQLYSAATPNGIKVAACLEEISIIKSVEDVIDYEPHSVDLRHGECRQKDFVEIFPNGKVCNYRLILNINYNIEDPSIGRSTWPFGQSSQSL